MSNNPKVTRRPQNMTPKEIRHLFIDAEITQAEIARDLDVSQEAVYQIVEGSSTSHRIRAHIAKRLGVDIKRIWPDPYLYFGGPRKAGRPTCDSQQRAA